MSHLWLLSSTPHSKMLFQCLGILTAPLYTSWGPFALKARGWRKEASPQARGGHKVQERRENRTAPGWLWRAGSRGWDKGGGGTERNWGLRDMQPHFEGAGLIWDAQDRALEGSQKARGTDTGVRAQPHRIPHPHCACFGICSLAFW